MKARSICLAVSLTSLLVAWVPASGAATGSSYDKPTWWAKYQRVSASGFKPAGTKPTTSVKVGPNVDVSNEETPQSETSIAVDPSNPSRLVAGSNEIVRLPMRGYFSSDGGASWGGVDLPLPPPLVHNGYDFGSDPAVAWDTRGNAYYSYIVAFFSAGYGLNGTEMAVSRSSDGGRTWTATYFGLQTGSAQFNDKPYVTVDTNPNSPFRNTIYVAWDRTGGNSSSSGVLVSRSTDGGRTFSDPVYASSTASGPKSDVGAQPFAGPDGTLYVAWHDVRNSALVEASSTDGGSTFGPTHTIAPTQVAFDIDVPAEASRGALVYPACGALPTGSLVCSWIDGTLSGGTDVFVSRSSNGGVSWSSAVRVNDDPTSAVNDQFNQWLAVDPTDGSVNVSWSDTRGDPTRHRTDEFLARSLDGGATFGPNVKVSTAPTDETCCGANLGNQYGDYEGLAAFGGAIHPVWTDRRESVASLGEEVFTATVRAK